MTELVGKIQVREENQSVLSSRILIVTAVLLLGFLAGILFGRESGSNKRQVGVSNSSEIVVPAQGLVFKSEDGTPLMRIRKNEWGVAVDVLGADGKPRIGLRNGLDDRGSVTVGSPVGTVGMIAANSNGASISLLGKYGKLAVELSSNTSHGGGSLSINEGSQGDESVQILSGLKRNKTKGIVKILGAGGPIWQAPPIEH